MKQPRLNKTEKKALSEFVRRLLAKFGQRIILVKLFGSRARGERHWHSDVDVLIVVKRFTKKFRWDVTEIECQIDEKYDYKAHLSPIEMSLAEYKWMIGRRWPFIVTVEEDGIELWKNPEIELPEMER